jgi:serine/threonine protein kinase
MRADLWSLGCMAYELLTGKPPFKSADEQTTFAKILWCDLEFPSTMPEAAKSFCSQLIQLETERRLGAGEDGFERLRRHEFFTGIDFPTLRDAKIAELELKGHSELPFSGAHSFASEDAMNYAIISPQMFYKLDFEYFSNNHAACRGPEDSRPKQPVLVKEGTQRTIRVGMLRKRCGWIFYQQRKIVLTDEPRLSYYAPNLEYKV